MSSAPNVIEFPGARAQAARARQLELLHAAAEERLRIARELHDVVAYSFATIKVHAGVALHLLDDAPEQLVAALHAIDSASKEALGEMRSILGVLRGGDDAGPATSAPGVDRLPELAASMTAAGVQTEVVVTGEPRSLPPAVDTTAFRIAQESLSNVLRHVGQASAVVTLAYEPDCITLEVENDEGDDAGAAVGSSNGPGHGLVGMRERVAALGGRLEAGLTPGGGFRVLARLPLFVRS